MSLLTKITDFVGGSLFKEIKEGVMSYFPPDMSPQQKAEVELNVERLLMEKQAKANEFLRQSATQLDKRIAEQEGTAGDLKTIPILGHIVLFARGAQRPIWGFATLWMDTKWFFGNYTFDEQQQTALIVINTLVLGFLFGERAVQNLTPMIVQVFAKKKT
jgi:hypothetical protein